MTTTTESRTYDAVFILPASLAEDELQKLVQQIKKIMEDFGASINQEDSLGVREFERPLQNSKERSGYYLRLNCTGPAELDAKLRSRFRLREDVIRMMLTQAPVRSPKVETDEVPEDAESTGTPAAAEAAGEAPAPAPAAAPAVDAGSEGGPSADAAEEPKQDGVTE
jgi:ribosomal protein S6